MKVILLLAVARNKKFRQNFFLSHPSISEKIPVGIYKAQNYPVSI